MPKHALPAAAEGLPKPTPTANQHAAVDLAEIDALRARLNRLAASVGGDLPDGELLDIYEKLKAIWSERDPINERVAEIQNGVLRDAERRSFFGGAISSADRELFRLRLPAGAAQWTAETLDRAQRVLDRGDVLVKDVQRARDAIASARAKLEDGRRLYDRLDAENGFSRDVKRVEILDEASFELEKRAMAIAPENLDLHDELVRRLVDHLRSHLPAPVPA